MKESTLLGLGYVLLIVGALIFAAQCARFVRREPAELAPVGLDEPGDWEYSTRTQAVSP